MLKSVMHVENYVESMLKSMLKFQHVLKSVMHVENYVESMLKFQHMLILSGRFQAC